MAVTKTTKSTWGRFEAAVDDTRRNIVWSSEGVGGAGKTHFLLTAPEPIAVFLFDPAGLKGLMSNDLFKSKDIRVINYKFNPGRYKEMSDRAQLAQDELAKFEEDMDIAMGIARTIGWDKEDHVWEMLRYANNENFQAEPKSYYELNMQYRGWFQSVEEAGINFGVLRGMKEKWGKTGVNQRTGRPTYGGLGEMVARGQKEVTELVQINLSHRWDDDDREFKTRIMEKCRIGNAVELLGQEFGNLDFETLVMTLYPEVEYGEWL